MQVSHLHSHLIVILSQLNLMLPKGDAAADDAWELRLALEGKDAIIADLTRKNEELEDQLVKNTAPLPGHKRVS